MKFDWENYAVDEAKKPLVFTDWIRGAFELAKNGNFKTDDLTSVLRDEGCPSYLLEQDVFREMVRRAVTV